MIRSVVVGVGSSLPKKVLTNKEIESLVETTDEWILARTGICERHIAADGEFTSTFATQAARHALDHAGLQPNDIDIVIVATTTPDETMPSTATKVQHLLGMTRGAAFDLNAACSGFVYALTVANALIVSGQARRVLVIGAETFSRIIDWKDRGTCILFGDGGGAVVLDAQNGEGKPHDRGILHTSIHSAGEFGPLLHTTGGVSMTRTPGVVEMAGKEIFRHAVAKMADSVQEALKATGLGLSDIDWLIPHQANVRILDATAQKLGVSEDRAIVTVGQHANTSAASIPLALDTAVRQGKIKSGHLIVMPALGAGLTWGTCLIRW